MNDQPQIGRADQHANKLSEVNFSYTGALVDKMIDRIVLLYHQFVSNKAPNSTSAMPIFPNRGFVSFPSGYDYGSNRQRGT